MKLLFIEDVESKFEEVLAVLAESLRSGLEISRAKTLIDAEDLIMEEGWDLVILDLSMDINGNGSTQGAGHATLGGLDVMERMSLLKIEHPLLLVTGFDSFQDYERFDNAIMNLTDISKLARDWLGPSYIGSVRYGAANWERQLARTIQQWANR